MTFSIEKILSIDLAFPGISFGFESWALESYLKILEDQIAFAQKTYRERAEAELQKLESELEDLEYGNKLFEIDEVADAQIPRFFRIGAVIAIWGLFESFVTDIAIYTAKKEGAKIALRDIRAANFRDQTYKYFEGVLKINIPWSKSERGQLADLQQLRNILAHRNGRLMDLPIEQEKKYRAFVRKLSEVVVENSQVVISPKYIENSSQLTFNVVGRLAQLIADRYDGPSTA